MNNSFVVSWSGGKDSALALHRAQSEGMQVSYLFTMFSPDSFSKSHRIPRTLVQKQAEAMGIPLVEGIASWETYEDEFKKILSTLKRKGVVGCIFGDIDLDEHIEWCRKVCADIGLDAVHPLHGSTQEELLDELIETGFQTVIIVVKQDKLGSQYLGKNLDPALIKELANLGISPSGEFGEYHTLVVDGPIFHKTSLEEHLKSSRPRIVTQEGYSFWNLA
mgnify:CR=1 FL=1